MIVEMTRRAHEQFRSKRHSLRLTQAEVAARLDVDPSWVSRIERGHVDHLPVDLALRIQREFGIPVESWVRGAA